MAQPVLAVHPTQMATESDQALGELREVLPSILKGIGVMRHSINLNLENLETRLAPALAIYGLKQALPAFPATHLVSAQSFTAASPVRIDYGTTNVAGSSDPEGDGI